MAAKATYIKGCQILAEIATQNAGKLGSFEQLNQSK